MEENLSSPHDGAYRPARRCVHLCAQRAASWPQLAVSRCDCGHAWHGWARSLLLYLVVERGSRLLHYLVVERSSLPAALFSSGAWLPAALSSSGARLPAAFI
jgi:hypothetical protein